MPHPKEIFNNPRVHALYKVGHPQGQLVKKLFEILLESVPEKTSEIELALSKNEWDILVRNPHSLKSSFGNLGIDSVMEKWLELERLAKHRDEEAYKKLYPKTKAESDIYLNEIRSAVKNFEEWIATFNFGNTLK